MDQQKIESLLEKLYGKADNNGRLISQNYNPVVNEHRQIILIQSMQNYFHGEDFAILKYDSWIMDKIRNKEDAWVDGFLPYCLDSTTGGHVDQENGQDVFIYAETKKTYLKRKAATFADSQGFVKIHDFGFVQGAENSVHLTAAFSKSKIMIGWEEDDNIALTTVATIPQYSSEPCFSHPEDMSKSFAAFLSPWKKPISLASANYTPVISHELYRDLIVRADKKFIEDTAIQT